MKNSVSKNWVKLDNAAKIFPSVGNEKDPKVFRLVCALYEDVDPKFLQKALLITIEEFPLFKSVLRHGVFWYYLESSQIIPVVCEEHQSICDILYNKTSDNLLFKVTYFKKRINLEAYHALTDGTGAMQFLKTLVINYLSLILKKEKNTVISDYDASYTQRKEDSFQKYFITNHKNKSSDKKQRAYKISGQPIPDNRLLVIEGDMSVKELLSLAHKYNTTLTIYLVAVFLYSIYIDMPKKHLNSPLSMDVPVNLRNYFNSATARNFFGVVNISQVFKRDTTVKSIIDMLKISFKEKLTEENVMQRTNKLIAIGNNLFISSIPLVLKDYILRFADKMIEKNVTCSLSNIGEVTMPNEFLEYIDKFSAFTSTKKIQAGVCSFKDTLTFTFTSPFISTDIQKNFFRYLASEGVNINISSNYDNLSIITNY